MTSHDLPEIGLGTWDNTDPDVCAESVATALEAGYRHVDTAQYYGNEASVGRGIARADVDRADVVVATKLHPETCGLDYEGVLAGAAESAERLGVEYIDLLYVHWPVLDYDAEETLSAFAELRDRGLVEHIGVSNFSIDLLDEARDVLGDALFAHQIEVHPLLQQEELLAYAGEHDHYVVAYSPIARGRVFEVDEMSRVAEKHDASEVQVTLAWLLSKENVVAIPASTDPDHLRENFAGRELELDDDDVELIDSIDREERLVERDGAPWLI